MKKKPAAEPAATTSYLKTSSPPNNSAIHNDTEIIKGVMSSAAEAELGAMYINARKAVEEQIILEEMGHKQPATPVQVDNSSTNGCNQNVRKPWICAFIGCEIAARRNNSDFIGASAPRTMPTTGRNIIRRRTIAT